MQNMEALYDELAPEVQVLIDYLMDAAEVFLRNRHDFVPVGAAVDTWGNVHSIMATTGEEYANSEEILPLLHDALRNQAAEEHFVMVGVVENVKVFFADAPPTDAMKVLIEHERGLVAAFYGPYKRKFLRGYSFGQVFMKFVDAEINPWKLCA